ncbi:MAG: nitroreductase/quinone reductase family protein [Pseudohongiellaceae bacterium]
MKKLKLGIAILSVALLGALATLSVTGLEPEYMDYTSEAYNQRGRMTYPGLWLKGEVVSEPMDNWDWVLEVDHPVRGNTIMLETKTWYGVPYSVTILPTPRGESLYIGGSARGERLSRKFPHYKQWWANVERDPRVRLKIDGRIYEMTAALVHDPQELRQVLGRDPVSSRVAEDGSQELVAKWYYWKVTQRNIVEY